MSRGRKGSEEEAPTLALELLAMFWSASSCLIWMAAGEDRMSAASRMSWFGVVSGERGNKAYDRPWQSRLRPWRQ